MDGIQNLGERIVEAARLAVAMHLYESVARNTTADNAVVDRAVRQILRRRVETGGAGPCDAGNSSRLGDLVTDDERNGLMGRDEDRDANP